MWAVFLGATPKGATHQKLLDRGGLFFFILLVRFYFCCLHIFADQARTKKRVLAAGCGCGCALR